MPYGVQTSHPAFQEFGVVPLAEFDKMKAEIMGEMESKDIKSVKTLKATFSYVAASSGFGFDKDAFQEKYPDLYNQFITKPTSKKSSLTIKFK